MSHMGKVRVDWETREDNTPDPVTEVRAAIDTFTGTVEQRFGALEGTLTELRTRLDRTETVLRRPGTAPEQRSAGELETRAFAGFLRGGVERMAADEVRSLNVSTDSAGGYLAPEQFVTEILKNLVLFSPIRSVARVTPTGAGKVILPKRTGTLTASWVGETADRSGTQPSYGQNPYEVHESACYVDVSNALLEDSAFDMGAELTRDFAEEFGRLEGDAFVNGDGNGKPAGFLVNADIPEVEVSGVTADALIDLYHALPAFYAGNAVWAMNRTTIGAVRKLKASDGHYLWQEALSAGNPPTILGRPVIEMPDMPDAASSASPVVFGDFQAGYRIFDRIALSVLRDPYTVQAKGLVRFHARRRVGGGVAKAEALRKLTVA